MALAPTIDQLVEAAECAFWRSIADAVPADSGDIDPMIDQRFRAAARAAVVNWLELNAPAEPPAEWFGESDPDNDDLLDDPLHPEAGPEAR